MSWAGLAVLGIFVLLGLAFVAVAIAAFIGDLRNSPRDGDWWI